MQRVMVGEKAYEIKSHKSHTNCSILKILE